MQRWLLSLLLPLLLFTAQGSQPAAAWNSYGHMEAAAVAWTKLLPATRERVAELLKLNPMYERWVKDVPAADQARVAFIRASTWADDIGMDPGYVSDGPRNGFQPPPGSDASRNIGYADLFRHKYWHFINMPFSLDGTPLQPPATPNVKTQIAAFRAALAARPALPANIRSYDLVWLIHLVGDAHQPLHAASRFTRDQPNGDEGGNLVKVRCASGCGESSLHAFWDNVLGPYGPTIQEVTAAAGALAAPPADLAATGDETTWLQESFDLARTVAYAAPVIGDGAGPFLLTEAYQAKALEVARQRIALAGVRLANLLNDVLR